MPKAKEKQDDGAQVSIRGTPREIQEASADMVEAARESAKRIAGEQNGKPKVSRDINELLQYAEYRCRAIRRVPPAGTMAINPQTRRPARLVSSIEIGLPTTLAEIEDELRQGPGGKVWQIEVMNELGKRISGARINIDASPGPVFDDTIGGVPLMTTPVGGSQWDPLTNPYLAQHLMDDDDEDEKEEKELKREERRLRLQEIQDRAEERRENRERNRHALTAESSQAMNELKSEIGRLKDSFLDKVRGIEDTFKEWKHTKETADVRDRGDNERRIGELKTALERSNSDFQRGLSDLKAQLAAGSADKGVLSAITELQKSQSHGSAEITKAMIGALTAKAEAQASDPIEKFVSAFSMMAQATGMGGFAATDDPITAAIKGVESGVKEFLDYKRSQGETMSEEKIEAKIAEEKAKILADPALVEIIGDAVKTALVKKSGQKKLPPAKKEGGEAKPPAKTEPNPVEQQFKARVNEWMKVILAEIDVMPGNAQLIDFALDHLPRKFLKELVKVVGKPLEAAKAIAPHVEPEVLEEFSTKLLADEEKRNWLAQQLQALAEEFNAILEEEAEAKKGKETEGAAEEK